MFTSVDKAIVALIMATAYLVNTYTNFHFSLDQNAVSSIVAAVTPLLVWLVPNKSA
jgi:hypothetical protein